MGILFTIIQYFLVAACIYFGLLGLLVLYWLYYIFMIFMTVLLIRSHNHELIKAI